jgi:hypothetical protein
MFLIGIGYLITINLEIRKIRKSFKDLPQDIYICNNKNSLENIE